MAITPDNPEGEIDVRIIQGQKLKVMVLKKLKHIKKPEPQLFKAAVA